MPLKPLFSHVSTFFELDLIGDFTDAIFFNAVWNEFQTDLDDDSLRRLCRPKGKLALKYFDIAGDPLGFGVSGILFHGRMNCDISW